MKYRKIYFVFLSFFLFLESGVNTQEYTAKDFKKGLVYMYTQQSHTDTFVLIDDAERVYSPCMVRDPKGCPVDYPYIGNVKKRISRDVITLNNNNSYWCKTSLLSNLVRKETSDYFPHFFCDKDGWIKK